MTLNPTEHVLDNPAWYSLNTNHAHFAIGDENAKAPDSEPALPAVSDAAA